MKTIITSHDSLLTTLRLKVAFILIAFVFIHNGEAVNPPPDGGYPGGNTAEGDNALFNLTTGTGNTAIGSNALFHNSTGRNNTAEGDVALQNNTTGIDNTAIGVFALTGNTIGNSNTAIGFFALFGNTTGNSNTATGVETLTNNSTGSNNTANGFEALQNNSTGHENTANGVSTLFSNTIGNNNTAVGFEALASNTTGNNNTANGFNALSNNTIGMNNAGIGVNALFSNTTGNLNIAFGVNSLVRNTAGSSNIALGVNAGSNLTIGNNNIDIGNAGVPAEGNTTRIGTQGTQRRTFVAGISSTAVAGSPIVVNANGQLGVAASSERFKDEIKPMKNVSKAILALQPVTFRYKKSIDPDRVSQFGLVAEEVARVNPDLVARDAEGEVYSVRYEAVNAMLLNEFLKQHRKVEKQEATIADLKRSVAKQRKEFEITLTRQQNEIEALTSGFEKVSAQVGLRAFGTKVIATEQATSKRTDND